MVPGRKGEVLVTVVEEKLSSVGPVDPTIINIITPHTYHNNTAPHHTSTSRLRAGEDLWMNAGISLYTRLAYEPGDGDIKLFWLIKRGTLDHSLLYQHLQINNKQQSGVSSIYTLFIFIKTYPTL